MQKSGKPESSWDGDKDPKPNYHSPNLNGNYWSEGLPYSGEEHCLAGMLNNEDGYSSTSFDHHGGPDHELDPSRFITEIRRNARKREIDRNYRERNKNKDKEMRSKLCELDDENRDLMCENESLKRKLVSVNQSLQSQATDIQHLRNETEFWNLEHQKQTALVQTLSDQLLASSAARADNQSLLEQNRRLRAGEDDETLSKLAEDTANLKLENATLKLNNDALTDKMVHHRN